MRIRVLILLCLALMAAAGPAFAQAANPYDLSWAALDPGNDWAAQVIRFIFPIPGTAPGTPTGNEATVIQLIVGQFTGFVAAIACAFVVYTTIINVHRAAETSRILGNNQSWIFVVRLGFAAIMMFPLAGGFSTGQYLVMQGALTGVGMAKTLYTNAIKAVGPDGMVIAQPMIPGTQAIVAGLIDSELCMDLVNLATNTTNAASGPMVPIPQPVSGGDAGIGDGFTVFRYALSAGNATGTPVCGSVSLLTPKTNQQTIAGVSIDMAAIQQAVLSNVLNGSIRNQVAVIALNLWTDKTAAALVPLQAVFTNATNAYAATLTTTATAIAAQLNAALQAQAQAARNGGIGLLQGEVQQDTLGWTGAGAYYLEIALMNASTLSLLQATPTPTAPTYEGLGMALSYDLAPLVAAQKSFMDTLNTVVQTRDGTTTPNGVPHTLASAKDDAQGKSILDRVLGQLNITNGVLSTLTGYLMPNAQIWTDPFGGLINLGQTLINTALAALGLAAVLASTTASTGLAMWNAMTFNWGAAAATVAGHAVMNFLGVPVFLGLLALLLPGIMIAYVLPLIPWVIWMAGVMGWIILVCEAMIAVPLWMLAHMTIGGEGLHGRGIEGWSLLFSVVFRPTLMVIGLFLGYFVFDCMSWLIRETFGIAAGFVLQHGWLVSNLIGLVVMMNIFVMTQVVAAITSFRMVALLPHHLPRLIGFTSANRVDGDAFQQRAAWAAGEVAGGGVVGAIAKGADGFKESTASLPRGPAGYISGLQGSASDNTGGMDSTLRSSTDSEPRREDSEDV